MEAMGREFDLIVMGCAGMARRRHPLEEALSVQVIDPTRAAVAIAIGDAGADALDAAYG
jgi:Asp/Glu/hydantoin racemase